MEYFFSHLPYILIVGVTLGLIAFATVMMQAKNNEDRGEDEPQCNFNCSACMSHYRDQHRCAGPKDTSQ